MRHKESDLQIKCVRWFRYQYPQYAMLLTHPINEGNGNRISGAIHKAEGAVPGVPDLLLFMPALFEEESDEPVTHCHVMNGTAKQWTDYSHYVTCFGLGIEMKEEKGRQSQAQKDFQKMFEAAGYMYVVVRSLESFQELINNYIAHTPGDDRRRIASAHVEIEQAATAKAREQFKDLLKPRK